MASPTQSNLLAVVLLVVAVFLVRLWRQRHPSALSKGMAAAKAPAAAGTSLRNLVEHPASRPAFDFSRQDMAGIGTIELPTGPDWEQEDNTLYNDGLGLVIVIQNQAEGMAGYERAYLESYDEVNQRDAPNWRRGPEELGQVAGITTARTTGSFHNGTAMVTRDYLFFASTSTVLFQSRVPAVHAAALDLTDYLASTFRRK